MTSVARNGGADGDRTRDLLSARQALIPAELQPHRAYVDRGDAESAENAASRGTANPKPPGDVAERMIGGGRRSVNKRRHRERRYPCVQASIGRRSEYRDIGGRQTRPSEHQVTVCWPTRVCCVDRVASSLLIPVTSSCALRDSLPYGVGTLMNSRSLRPLRLGGRSPLRLLYDSHVEAGVLPEDARDSPAGALEDVLHLWFGNKKIVIPGSCALLVAHPETDLARHPPSASVAFVIRAMLLDVRFVGIPTLGQNPTGRTRDALESSEEPPGSAPTAEHAEVVPHHEDGIEASDSVVNLRHGHDPHVREPSPSADLDGPGRHVDAGCRKAVFLEVYQMPSRAAADIEHPSSDMTHCALLAPRPVREGGEVQPRALGDTDEPVIPLHDLGSPVSLVEIEVGTPLGVLPLGQHGLRLALVCVLLARR
jgi:hypothetical protein